MFVHCVALAVHAVRGFGEESCVYTVGVEAFKGMYLGWGLLAAFCGALGVPGVVGHLASRVSSASSVAVDLVVGEEAAPVGGGCEHCVGCLDYYWVICQCVSLPLCCGGGLQT